MKYLSIQRPYQAILTDGPVPIFHPKAGEALLKMRYGGICGSDLNTFRGSMAYASYPRIPGHEFSAEILEIADKGQTFRPGAVVTANPYFNCGHCYSCRRGLVNCCENNETMGVQRDGAFQEYLVMPVNRLVSGDGIPAQQLALVEPLSVGYHGAERAKIKHGDHVLIMGAGAIGVATAISAQLMGGTVCICDVDQNKLQYIRKNFHFAGTILNDSPEHLQEQVNSRTGGNGFDVTVEAVGLPSTFNACVESAAFGGTIVQIGVSSKPAEFDFTLIQKKELNLLGSRNARKEDFLHIIRMIKDGRLNPKPMITSIYAFSQAEKAFQEFHRKDHFNLKVLLDFSR